MVERKVGEVFCSFNGARLLVRPGHNCEECYFNVGYCAAKKVKSWFKEVGECDAAGRSDRMSVVFVHELDWTLDEIMKGGRDGKE